MGCASSSPLINGGGPGGVVESAKEAATKTANDVLHAGESAIHDVGEHVKEAVQNVTHELETVLGGGGKKSDHINEEDQPTVNGHGDGDDGPVDGNPDYQIIRLKGASRQGSAEETELLENRKNELMSKAPTGGGGGGGGGEDPDRLADDLMKETEELMRDAETGIHEMTTRITSADDGTIEILNLEEPEIERILAAGADAPDSPKATLHHSLAVPAPEAARAGRDEAMPLGAPEAKEQPDVQESIWRTPQASLDGESVCSSSGGEEHFRNEVLRATVIRTPRGTRRSPSGTRAPPPSIARSERMQRFIFKLNSVILSDIEERGGGCEEGSIVRQLERNPERVVELLSKSSAAGGDESDGDVNDVDDDTPTGSWSEPAKGTPRAPGVLRRQHSVSLEGPLTNVDSSSGLTESLYRHGGGIADENEEEGNERTSVRLQDIPPAVRLRALMRFKSFEALGSNSSTERKKARRRMKSLDTIDAVEVEEETAEEQRDGEPSPDDFRDVPYNPEEEERICEELLAELCALEAADRADAEVDPNAGDAGNHANGEEPDSVEDEQTLQAGSGPKTAWEKLQDYLQRVPKRRSSTYDLFFDNDEDILRTLFTHHKARQLFHFSSSSSSDTL